MRAAQSAARMSGMNAKADQEKFLVAYPNGSGPFHREALLTWNTWQCCGYALDHNIDDVAFVRAMVEEIAREHSVDRKRIYATGLSNGGMMTYRVGCELADIFAAIAPVAGALNTEGCRPSAPVSVIAFHGKADQHIRYEGGTPGTTVDVRHPREDKSVASAIDFWKQHDRCEGTPATDKKGSVTHVAYSCPATSTAVELYAIDGQGHAWPGGEKGIRAGNVDAPTTEISATALMWDFFARHPKK
jgi:polyhydroxybutyrate depolymerase